MQVLSRLIYLKIILLIFHTFLTPLGGGTQSNSLILDNHCYIIVLNNDSFAYFRTCYIAPERFVKTLSSELSNTLLLSEQELKTGDLHPMMDIFSAGCALTELYNEGHPPFDFSQLLGELNIHKDRI